MQSAKPLRCPRKMSELGQEEASGRVAPAYGMPGDPAAIEAMILERARARRRPSGTPLESAPVFAPGHSSSGGAPVSGGGRGGSPRRSRSHAHQQHRDPLNGTGTAHLSNASPARRPLIGVESAAHAGLDTATTVQYITQLEHQLTALEGEHGRLCRVLLKSVAHNAVADCELAEASTRREITDEAMASQLRISGLLAKHLAHTAVTLGIHEQLSNVRTGNDPRRSFADAVTSLGEIRGDLEATAEAINAAGASVRQRDSAWRAEMAALTDAVSTTRAEVLRGLSHQGSSTADAVDALGKEIRRSLSNVNESVQGVETGTAVKLHSMLQQHAATADASVAGITAAIGQLHNEVRADERERQRYMSEQFHALSRRFDDVLSKQRSDGPSSPVDSRAAVNPDDIARAVDEAVRSSSAAVAQRVSDDVVEAMTAGEQRRLEAQNRAEVSTSAVASLSALSAAATAHMDALCRGYVEALAGKASVVAEEIPRAMRAAEAAVESLSASFATALERAAAVAIRQQQPNCDVVPSRQAPASCSASCQTTPARTATADVQAVERTRPCGVQTNDAGAHRAVAVQTSVPLPLSPSRRASAEHPPAVDHHAADDEGFTTFPSVSDEITASGSPNASNVFGPPGITHSMEVSSSPGKGGLRTLPPTPLPASPTHSFEATKRGGTMSPVGAAAQSGQKHPAAAGAREQKPARVVASAPPPSAKHDSTDDSDDLSSDVDLSLEEDDSNAQRSPPLINTLRRGSSLTSESRSPTAASGGAAGLPPRPQAQATRKAPPAAPSIEVEGVPLQLVTSESLDAAPDFRGGGADDLFANLSINAYPPDATLLDAGMPDSVRSNDSLADMEAGTSALGRRLAGGAASPRFSGGKTRVAGSPRGEAIPSPFREAARLKRASSFDSPTASVRSPRNRAVCFLGDDAGGSSQNLSPQRSKEFSSSPQATPRSVVSPRSSGNGGLMLPASSVMPRQVSPAPDSMMTTPTGVTPVATPTASALHLGSKKRGLPSLGGLGGQKPAASTAASMGVPGKSGTLGSGGSSQSLVSWSPASNSPGTGTGFPNRPAASAGAGAAGSPKAAAYDDWDEEDD